MSLTEVEQLPAGEVCPNLFRNSALPHPLSLPALLLWLIGATLCPPAHYIVLFWVFFCAKVGLLTSLQRFLIPFVSHSHLRVCQVSPSPSLQIPFFFFFFNQLFSTAPSIRSFRSLYVILLLLILCFTDYLQPQHENHGRLK